ncbi:hypothetical protein KSD_05880 [Ktedonobacter sp. SOSP1-85]|uniref:PAS domain-containing sensor histidine kinase n=1 Tax=Ktedonobacter sp. SOSP1-85 TaxID=2778367 RepID=UPI0019150235|nr:PAS domain-containing sensor histidine kinase [Ktedonobacter sp. SOSP1-85]GHO72817.1 hypothetical protein KSD_05880 [Ktedonobacter sp. SOSP1-85]
MAHSGDFFDQHASASSSFRQISPTHLRSFLDISPDALLLVNQSGTIVMFNEQTAALFGYAEKELFGAPLEILLPPRIREAYLRHQQQYFAAPYARSMGAGLELCGQRKNGAEFPVDVSLRPLLLDGELHILGAIRDVTAQRVTERKYAVQAQRLSLLTDLMNLAVDAILMSDPMNRIIFWNHGAERLYGWSEQEALGRISHTLLETRYPQSRAVTGTILEQQGQWEGELTHTCHDGSKVLVESRQALIRDNQGEPLAILEVNRDITERHTREQMERAYCEETVGRETLFHQILDSLPCVVFLVAGADARMLFANRAAYQVWGVPWMFQQPLGEFFNTNGITLLNAQGRPLSVEHYATLRAIRTGEPVRDFQTMILPDERTLPIQVYAEPFSPPQSAGIPASEPVVLVTYEDVTVLKEAEKLKDEFVGIAAHELRTPLTVLSGYVDILLRQTSREGTSPLSERQQKVVTAIKEATLRLSTLTGDLLDVTRLQAGRLVLKCCSTNIVPLVRRVASYCQHTTEKHSIEVSTARERAIVIVDESRLEQILTNLIDNAIKYSPQGGPVLISIEEDLLHRQIQIKVQDRGIGIPQHQHGRIFGRFMRAENALAWEISGTGLGLYLCYELVELMGGHIWFDSQEGVGSTFFVSFPMSEGSEEWP